MLGIGLTEIVKDDQEVLMQLRDNKPGLAYANMWCIPGGHVETGESDELGARREVEEETGYIPVEMELVTELEFNRVGEEVRWVRREELDALNVEEGQKEVMMKLVR